MQFNRWDLLRGALREMADLPLVPVGWTEKQRGFTEREGVPYTSSDDALLDEIERTAFDFFWNEAGATTGPVKDRALLNGNDKHTEASIAATGFGLSGLCIADARSYRKKEEIVERVRGTLRFL